MAFPPISILRENDPEKSKCGRTSGHGVQSFGTFCPIGRGRRTRDGGFHIRPVCCRNQPFVSGLPAPNKALFSCRFKCPCPPRRQRHFHGNADRAYNTLHFAPQSRVPNGALPPLETPATNRRYAPSREHSACCCQQPVSWSACSFL